MERYFVLALVGLGACEQRVKDGGDYGDADGRDGADTDDTDAADDDDDGVDTGDGAARRGRVFYVMTNAADGNEIVAFEHDDADQVREFGRFETMGRGLGTVELPLLAEGDGIDPLVSQGSLHRMGDYLLAVNAGSASVTVFEVASNGELALIDVEELGGGFPTTIASREDRVFVGISGGPEATAGAAGIAVLSMDRMTGELTADTEPRLPLATPGSHVADLFVSADGRFLAASELLDGSIAVWPIGEDGAFGEVMRTPSVGEGPFGMDGTGELLFVAEAAPQTPNGSSVSSYRFEPDGTLTPVTRSVPNEQSATCWIELTSDGRNAVTSNTESDTISTYRIGRDGGIEVGRPAVPSGDGPVDLSMTADDRYLYTLLGAEGQVAIYDLGDGVQLVNHTTDLELPRLGAQGILAW